MKRRVVITGVGPVTAIGIGKDKFLEGLRTGKCAISENTRFDTTDHSVKIAAQINDFNAADYIESKKELRRLDLCSQYALAGTKLALEDSQLVIGEHIEENNIMVRLGTGVGGIETTLNNAKILLEKGPSRVSPSMVPMMMPNAPAANISIFNRILGQSITVNSACSSAADAITDTYDKILLGRYDIGITGGTEAAILPICVASFAKAGALSKTGSRPFDKTRDGFVLGEGAGIIIVEELEHALQRNVPIYAEMVGYGHTSDANSIIAPDENASGITAAINIALEHANIKKEEVSYYNAHGTSTVLNDKTETLAIKNVFGSHSYNIPISSTKSMLGHSLGASAGIASIATLLSIKEGFIHPTINYKEKDDECDLDYVTKGLRETDINIAIKSSSGFGGHNAALIFKRYDE